MVCSVLLSTAFFVISFNGFFCVTKKSESKWTWDQNDQGPDGLPRGRPLILGHRGSSGMYPEHTAISYNEGAIQGADFIECDMVLTKDLQIVCSHESWIGEVSNVDDVNVGPSHQDFSSRLTTYNMDDDDPDADWDDKGNVTNFFTIDFTLKELKTLRRKQVNKLRDPFYDWKYGFVTLEEYIAIAKKHKVGIYPEFKEITATNKILKSRNLTVNFEDLGLQILRQHGYTKSTDNCFIQSFELSSLENLGSKTDLKRIFLLKSKPKANAETFKRVKKAGIYGIGIDKLLLVEIQGKDDEKPGHIKKINRDIAKQIKAEGLALHSFTFRNEPTYLNWDDGQDYINEYERFLDLEVDGFFTDFPKTLSNFFLSKSLQTNSAKGQFSDVNLTLMGLIFTIISIVQSC